MKRSTFIIIGVVVLIIVVIAYSTVILDNQKKIMQSQRMIMLNNMKEKSIEMITGSPTKPVENYTPVGYDTPSKRANC